MLDAKCKYYNGWLDFVNTTGRMQGVDRFLAQLRRAAGAKNKFRDLRVNGFPAPLIN